MQSKAKTVAEYIDSLPEDRKKAIRAVRTVIKKNLGRGFKEGMQYGMIGYFIPHSIYPKGYHCDPKQPVPFASLASQKNHMAVYLSCVYGMKEQEEWFRKAWAKSGKKLDMGKSCVRFKKLEDLPLEVVGEAIRRVPVEAFLEHYEAVMAKGARTSKGATKKPVRKKKVVAKKISTRKKPATKKATTKKNKASKVRRKR